MNSFLLVGVPLHLFFFCIMSFNICIYVNDEFANCEVFYAFSKFWKLLEAYKTQCGYGDKLIDFMCVEVLYQGCECIDCRDWKFICADHYYRNLRKWIVIRNEWWRVTNYMIASPAIEVLDFWLEIPVKYHVYNGRSLLVVFTNKLHHKNWGHVYISLSWTLAFFFR